ncbi:MAG: cation:proton antiporter [Deltaproteobacteria bacterium]|nr:cation:proton antiporter [Deltaproteobacteria bacterium]
MHILRFTALYGFWVVLSGRFEAKYLLIGACAAAGVTFLTRDLARPDGAPAGKSPLDFRAFIAATGRFFSYSLWLLWSIVQSNVEVAYLVLHPKLPIRPGLLSLRTKLRNRTGQIILANSITLTPGTITVDLDDGVYSVHALVPSAAQSLIDAKMQSKLEAIFGENEEAVTDVRWTDRPAKK